jgi:type III secretion system FlhB-like substrate exporter
MKHSVEHNLAQAARYRLLAQTTGEGAIRDALIQIARTYDVLAESQKHLDQSVKAIKALAELYRSISN